MTDDFHPVFERCDLVIDEHQGDAGPETIGADSNISTGSEVAELDDGVVVTFEGVYKKRSASVPDTLMLAVDLAESVGVGILSAWLYDKLQGEDAAISTPRGTIQTKDLSEEEFRMALELLLEIQEEESNEDDREG